MIVCDMLHFSDLQQRSVPEQLFAFAEAYLDSAEILCEKLYAKTEDSSYAHGSVVMSLAFHSLELFFKSGILRMHPDEQFAGRTGHDLDMLSKRYFKLYPKKEFQFELPFRSEFHESIGFMTSEELDALRALVEKHKSRAPEDQRHRYPIGIDGKTWKGAFGFSPHMFLATLVEMRNAFSATQKLLSNS